MDGSIPTVGSGVMGEVEATGGRAQTAEQAAARAADSRPTEAEAERALAQRLRARAPEAGAELYDRYAPRLYRFVLTRLLGAVESSEEVVVETLATAARDIARFDARRGSLFTWLLGIARRRIGLEVRRQQRAKSVPAWAQQPLESAAEIDAGQDVAAAVAGKLEAQRAVAALAAVLTEVEMEALVLCYGEELSVREIARVLGRSERAVHSILHRARRKARERLVDDGA